MSQLAEKKPRLFRKDDQTSRYTPSARTMFLENIGKKCKALLSAKEERELSIRAQTGDPDAFERMRDSNLKLVDYFAGLIGVDYPNIPIGDLISMGIPGLEKAIMMFDPAKRCRFSTYSYWWIRQAITRYIKKHEQSLHTTSVRAQDERNHLQKLVEQFTNDNSREPTFEEIGEITGFSSKKVQRLLRISQPVLSFDEPRGLDENDTITGLELLKDEEAIDPEKEAIRSVNRVRIRHRLDFLLPRDRFILTKHFNLDGEKLTLKEIGQVLHISKEGVRQKEQKALKQLREDPRVRAQLGEQDPT